MNTVGKQGDTKESIDCTDPGDKREQGVPREQGHSTPFLLLSVGNNWWPTAALVRLFSHVLGIIGEVAKQPAWALSEDGWV